MKMKLLILGVALVAVSLIFRRDLGELFASENTNVESGKSKKEKKKKQDKSSSPTSEVFIVQQWDLPQELNEVSGIAFIGDNRFACVQDEEGFIFIYNTSDRKIESKISFAGAGDYEGITLVGNTAYVVRADGMLYEIVNYQSAKPTITNYKTALSVKNNIEGLTFDKENNRLLLAVKDEDLVSGDQKGVYAFDLATKKLNNQPVYAVSTSHKLLSGKKKNKAVRPSAIGIEPVKENIYIIDGPQSRLLMLDKTGQLVEVKELGKEFAKPEGITFDPSGRMFISNEIGKKTAANIMEIRKNTN